MTVSPHSVSVRNLAAQFTRAIEVVDSHTEGNPTRVVVGGVPAPPGDTLAERQQWAIAHDDALRRLLNFEPRGSPMMCSVLLMPPIGPEADFSVLLMEQDEYVPMCGHCIIGAATTVVSTPMVRIEQPVTTVRFETIAGLVECNVEVEDERVGAVTVKNVPSFLLHRDRPIQVPGLGRLVVDVAFGGDFYVIVDADRLHLHLTPDNHQALEDAARSIVAALNEQLTIRHPDRPGINRCYETLFTSSHVSGADVKQTIVSPPGTLDRSPCGTGTCARLAAMFARNLVGLNQDVSFEGVLGTRFTARALSSEQRDGLTFISPSLRGRAYITGLATLLLQADDPFPRGFRIGPAPREL